MFVNIQDAIKARKAAEEKYVRPIVDEWKNKKPVEKQTLWAILLSKFGTAFYAFDTRHFKEIGAVSAKLSVVYVHQGIKYQVLRKTVRF